MEAKGKQQNRKDKCRLGWGTAACPLLTTFGKRCMKLKGKPSKDIR